MAYSLSDIHSVFSVDCVKIISLEYSNSISFWELIEKRDESALVLNLKESKSELVIQIG